MQRALRAALPVAVLFAFATPPVGAVLAGVSAPAPGAPIAGGAEELAPACVARIGSPCFFGCLAGESLAIVGLGVGPTGLATCGDATAVCPNQGRVVICEALGGTAAETDFGGVCSVNGIANVFAVAVCAACHRPGGAAPCAVMVDGAGRAGSPQAS